MTRLIMMVVSVAGLLFQMMAAQASDGYYNTRRIEPVTKSRVALVVGNSAYKNTSYLDNPVNDARDVAALLNKIGFDVDVQLDLTKEAFDDALRNYGDRLMGANVALFFYAGHGIQVEGENYLVPVDAQLNKRRDLRYEAVKLRHVLEEMESEERVNLVFLDACRNNPLSRSLARGMGNHRSLVGQGLAPVDAASGTLISYATKDGSVAEDGKGRNSPYTRALLKHMREPKLDIGIMLRRVRDSVIHWTDNQQVPWEYGSLRGGEFYLTEREIMEEPPPSPTIASASPSAADLSLDIELAFWDSIKNSRRPEEYQAYLAQYPNGKFAAVARIRAQSKPTPVQLRPQQVPVVVAPPPPPKVEAKPVVHDEEPRIRAREEKNQLHKVKQQLATCQRHMEAKRFTTPKGADAFTCYNGVLALDHGNSEALEGFKKIEAYYADGAQRYIKNGDFARASYYIGRLKAMELESSMMRATLFEDEIAQLRKERRKAEKVVHERRKERRKQASAQPAYRPAPAAAAPSYPQQTSPYAYGQSQPNYGQPAVSSGYSTPSRSSMSPMNSSLWGD
jgi:hypothetical protein